MKPIMVFCHCDHCNRSVILSADRVRKWEGVYCPWCGKNSVRVDSAYDLTIGKKLLPYEDALAAAVNKALEGKQLEG